MMKRLIVTACLLIVLVAVFAVLAGVVICAVVVADWAGVPGYFFVLLQVIFWALLCWRVSGGLVK